MKNAHPFWTPIVAIALPVAILAVSMSPQSIVVAQKLKAEEVVAKHLESLGTAEARAATRNRIATGASSLTFRQGGNGQAVGTALMASANKKNLIILAFDAPDYPYEKLGFDGSKLTVRPIRPGLRGPFGDFFLTHDVVFKEGLIGGSLSDSWPLLRLTERDAKIEYGGLKKVGDRQVHELKYFPKKGSDLKIKMFFDAETFRHVRTEYDRSVAATMGERPEQSVSNREVRYRVIEEFSDFKQEGGLTLPHTYKLELRVSNQRNPLLLDWVVQLNKFEFNQTMADKDFDTEAD